MANGIIGFLLILLIFFFVELRRNKTRITVCINEEGLKTDKQFFLEKRFTVSGFTLNYSDIGKYYLKITCFAVFIQWTSHEIYVKNSSTNI